MATKTKTFNLAGVDIICNRILTGKTKPSQGETPFTSAVDDGHIASKRNIIDVTAATRTMTAEESGSLVIFNKADGIVITLPALSAANIGLWYEFQINTSITSNAAKWSTGTQGTDFFIGSLITADPDGAPAEATFVVSGNGSTHDNISMNGTTTGGLIGTKVKVTAISATLWQVDGIMAASGDTATPFATS